MLGLVIIFISILTGIFAYFIANDSTPNADRQIVEIQAKKPGYTKDFIKIKKEKAKDIQVAFLALNKKREVGSFTIQPGFNYALRMKDSEKLVPAKSWFLEMNNQ